MRIAEADAKILRELAQRVRVLEASAVNRERRALWLAHDVGPGERPLVLTETDGGIGLVLPGWAPRCIEPLAQQVEHRLTEALAHYEVIGDDRVLEPWVNLGWRFDLGGYGVEVKREQGTDTHGGHTGFRWEPPLKDLERDFGRLRPRTFKVDRERTLAEKAAVEQALDGILPVRLRGNPWWTMGLTQTAIYLIGLEELMVYMYDEPEALHRLMAFLRDDHLALIDWMEREQLFCLNNENDYIGSGSFGYTRTLPAADAPAGGPARAKDLWVLLESQETVGIGPEQFAEFIFPYQQALGERFGRSYYGCCEPVHNRWDSLRRLSNLKRVSISPWCDQEFMARQMGKAYVFCRKPNPTLVSTEEFSEINIRADLRETLEITSRYGCSVELVMKDVHTLSGEPDRLQRWTALARECIAEHAAAGV